MNRRRAVRRTSDRKPRVAAGGSRHPVAPARFTPGDEEAGARESYEDAALYDFEYRRRRADVNFYRRIAEEKRDSRRQQGGALGPILDLACGTGRLTTPLLRDGHTVVGLDLSAPMLARAAWRVSRLGTARRRRALLVKGDLRTLGLAGSRFDLVICGFHSLQHLVDEQDLLACLRGVAACLRPGGWFAFDLLPPDPDWIARDPERRWARTVFRHPVTGQRLVYTTNHRYDPDRRTLHVRIYYQPVDAGGRPSGPERVRRLCHRQLDPAEVARLLAACGMEVIASFGGFDGRPLPRDGPDAGMAGPDIEQNIYVARIRRK